MVDVTQVCFDMREKLRRASAGAHIFVVAVFALYLIVFHSLPEGLSNDLPIAALRLNPRNVDAIANYAQQAIKRETYRLAGIDEAAKNEMPPRDEKPLDLVALRQLIVAGVSNAPLSATAYRLIGQISELEHEHKMGQWMALASKLSLHETAAVDYMMRQSLLDNNASASIDYADILMRSNVYAMSYVPPLIARMSEFPSAREELAKRLGQNPPWRKQVLNSFSSLHLANPLAPVKLFSTMKAGPNPPTEQELSGYVDYLLKERLYSSAYSVWFQFLPSTDLSYVAYVFNGSFERQPSGLPFDWVIKQGRDANAGIFARPDKPNESALFISFGQARATFPTIRQNLVLKPGAYQFNGTYFGELRARRGLQWSVTCAEGRVAGESQMLVGRIKSWRSFSFEVIVPTEGCQVQNLQLSHMVRSPSEQLASGYMWFDDLDIARTDLGPSPEATPTP